ncbi:hypothetical protein [Actinoallomurus oryzae]|uniref:hypothetical protein n=1 Tax=Actinoallomurus oryzae TaxID=502180 RepID=UPI0031EC6077
MSVPDWLEPIIRDAARRDGVTVSEFMADAVKSAIIAREAADRQAYEQAHGIDRRAQLEGAEEEFLADRTGRQGRVAGAA